MRTAKRILLTGSVVALSLNVASASMWKPRHKADQAAEAAAMPAAMTLTSIETDSASSPRLILRTSGTPAYTSYSPAPNTFVIDLTGTARGSAIVIPSTLPPGVATIVADETTDMGNRITRVTLQLSSAVSPEASAADNSVVITVPAPAVADAAAISPVANIAAAQTPRETEPHAEVVSEPVTTQVSEPIATAETLPPVITEVAAVNTAPARTASLPKARTLRNVATTGSGSALQVRLSADGEVTYKTFRLENPSRVVLDLTGVQNNVVRGNIATADPLLKRIRVSQFKSAPDPVTRVVLDLDAKAPYNVAKDGDQLVVTFGSDVARPAVAVAQTSSPVKVQTAHVNHPAAPVAATAPIQATAAPIVAASVPMTRPSQTVRASDIRATLAADSSTAASSTPVSYASASPVPTAVHETSVPVPMATEPIAKPAASSVDVTAQVPTVAENAWSVPEAPKSSARQIVNAAQTQTAPPSPKRRTTTTTTTSSEQPAPAVSEDVFNADQPTPSGTGNAVVRPSNPIENSQVTQLSGTSNGNIGRTLSSGDRTYTGEPLSLNLKDADIKDVLRTFAQLTGLNIAIDPGVAGTVTVDFTDVPWDQALELILKQNALSYVLEGNVMRVGSVARLTAEKAQIRELQEAERLNVSLTTLSFRLSYARASEVQSLLTQIASPRAKIIVDNRTNQLIISEIPTYLQTMRNLIDSVDVPTKQVMIEARIVETTKNFLQQYGFNWGFSGSANPALGTGTGLVFPNRVDVVGGPFEFGPGNPVLQLSLGSVLGAFDLDLALYAAEAEGLVKVISAPKVTTQDNVAAEIQSGFQIPYQTRVNFTTTISYVDATLRLSVTPQITEAGTVIMDIALQKTEPATGLAVEGGSGTPLTTRQARTRLMVRDGGTSVIGGIYSSKENNAQTRLPFLHQIPVIGNLFKTHDVSSTQDELLIFITPRIVRNS
jgi:type IV pilus assembly protein PilQ